MIQAGRQSVAQTVNSALTTLYRQIGQRVRRDILKETRADYGVEIVSALGRQFTGTHFKWLDVLSNQELECQLHQGELLARARLGVGKYADDVK